MRVSPVAARHLRLLPVAKTHVPAQHDAREASRMVPRGRRQLKALLVAVTLMAACVALTWWRG